MRTIFLFITIILTVYSCSTSKDNIKNTKQETTLIEFSIDKKSNQKVNELRFTSNVKAGETQKFMQQEFGKHRQEITTNRALPMQIWTEIKLFDWTEELFTIGVCGDYIKNPTIEIDGKQKYAIIEYNSVIAFDSKNNDCFKANHHLKDSLANYFILNTRKTK